jgi:hypothetical protein
MQRRKTRDDGGGRACALRDYAQEFFVVAYESAGAVP